MEEDIKAGIINRYGGEGIPEDLRGVFEDYFINDRDCDSSASDSDQSLAAELEPPEQEVVEISIDDIPVVFEVS